MSIINRFDNLTLLRVQKPARYLGGELNSIYDREKPCRFAMVFPDAYEVAQSGLGMKILYEIINRHEDFSCQRFFAPLPDMEEYLRETKTPLFSLESHTPLNEFDIIGFTLQYEMTYTNILNILDLGGVPRRSRDRVGEAPLVIGGGPCAYNPEPVADFFDVIVLGEGEEVIDEILERYSQWKGREEHSREELLLELSKIPGVYMPQFYEEQYDSDGRYQGLKPLREGIPGRIKKRMVENLDRCIFPSRPVVPFIQTVHDRVMLEIFRGCTRGCRFCKAGFIYRPIRERSVKKLQDMAAESIRTTGYDEVSLLSLSCSDYSRIEDLVRNFTESFSGQGVTLSLPSLRMDNFSLRLADIIKTPRKAGLTFAPEAGSQRLRDVINKNLTEEQILDTARRTKSMGWKMIKLYFMIGLPTENDQDIDETAALVDRILRETRLQLNVSVSHFVPQPHTPFQWEKMESRDELLRKIYRLKDHLRGRRIQFNWHEINTSFMEGIFSRGDRKLADIVEHAFESGARFDGWSDYFNYSIWEEAFKVKGIDPLTYLRERDVDEILPWDHIDTGVTKEYLLREKAKSLESQTTGDCREQCPACGVCGKGNGHKFDLEPIPEPVKSEETRELHDAVQRVRARFSKEGIMRWISHLDFQRTLIRALVRSKLPLTYSQGFHPRPRTSFSLPLPLGFTSDCEWVEFILSRNMDLKEIVKTLSGNLPPGIIIHEIKNISMAEKSIMSQELKIIYEVILPEKFNGMEEAPGLLEEFLNRGEILITRKNKAINIRPFLDGLSFITDGKRGKISMEILVKPQGSVKPYEAATLLLGEETAPLCVYHRSNIFIRRGDSWINP